MAGGLTLGGLATGTVAAQGPSKIRCGQTKLGDLSDKDPMFVRPDVGIGDPVPVYYDDYTLELDETTQVTIDMVTGVPGNSQGEGNKGGQGQGKGQTNGDTVLLLYDSAGNLVTFDDDGGDGFNSQIVINLGAGTWTVRATSWPTLAQFKYRLSVECA